jgi:cell shape-determining protein MreD
VRWTVFLIAACLFVAMDNSLLKSLRIGEAPNSAVWPAAAGCLAVFVCLFAPRAAALWACWMLGLLIDLTGPIPALSGGTLRILGPAALGFTVAALLVLRFRAAMFRRRILTVGVLTCGFLIVAGLVQMTIGAVQSWYPGGVQYWGSGPASTELFRRMLGALYSGLLGVPIAWLLFKTMPLWSFQSIQRGRPWR